MADIIPLRIAPTDPPEADQPEADPAAPVPKEPQVIEPLVIDAKRLAKLLCGGLKTIRTWDAAGKLPAPLRIGGRVLWRVDEINAWLEAGAPNRATWEAMKAASRK